MPVTPDAVGSAHEYVVPAGTISALLAPPPFAGTKEAALEEQIVKVTSSMNGLGFTTNGTVKALPAQPTELTGSTE